MSCGSYLRTAAVVPLMTMRIASASLFSCINVKIFFRPSLIVYPPLRTAGGSGSPPHRYSLLVIFTFLSLLNTRGEVWSPCTSFKKMATSNILKKHCSGSAFRKGGHVGSSRTYYCFTFRINVTSNALHCRYCCIRLANSNELFIS